MKIHLPASVPSIRVPAIGDRPHPYRDWYALLLIAGIFLLASLAWNVWFFIKITKGEMIGTNPSSEAKTPEDLVASARLLFEERAAEEARYRSEYRFIDPSK
ncbi:MAG TPA: hypothetical protein VFY28_02150 [Candidatus Paceibacterota bacterium]|nr:hypothetical protein [Candidatus Paceibacterota bacterium]